eukprot:6191807-Pleurochrysis_carterae.AAC.2
MSCISSLSSKANTKHHQSNKITGWQVNSPTHLICDENSFSSIACEPSGVFIGLQDCRCPGKGGNIHQCVRNSGGPLALQRTVVLQIDVVILIVQEELEGLVLRELHVNEINLHIQAYIFSYIFNASSNLQ